jgi:hypothetical protein
MNEHAITMVAGDAKPIAGSNRLAEQITAIGVRIGDLWW